MTEIIEPQKQAADNDELMKLCERIVAITKAGERAKDRLVYDEVKLICKSSRIDPIFHLVKNMVELDELETVCTVVNKAFLFENYETEEIYETYALRLAMNSTADQAEILASKFAELTSHELAGSNAQQVYNWLSEALDRDDLSNVSRLKIVDAKNHILGDNPDLDTSHISVAEAIKMLEEEPPTPPDQD